MQRLIFAAIILMLGTVSAGADAVAISQSGNGNNIGNRSGNETEAHMEKIAIALISTMGAIFIASLPFIFRKLQRSPQRTSVRRSPTRNSSPRFEKKDKGDD